MEYNTKRKKMILPEYGRNVHRMVDHIKSMEDRDQRNSAAKYVVSIMGNMNPHLRDVSDFKNKLWDHIHLMGNFELDIDAPYPMPERETLFAKPGKLKYPGGTFRLRHYGKILEKMVNYAIEFEDGEEKNLLVRYLANYMKRLYLTWNRSSVSDEIIFNDLRILSKGKLVPAVGTKLLDIKELLGPKPKKKKYTKPQRNDSRGKSYSHR